MKVKYVIGISCGYHDSAACLVKDGKVIAACEEERFTGIKHDSSFPHNTLNWFFDKFNISKENISEICFYENPITKLDRITESTKRGGIWKYFNRKKIINRNTESYNLLNKNIDKYKGKNTNVIFGNHHDSHLSYTYYTSPFKTSAILSVDGVGEWKTTSLSYGDKNKIKELQSIDFPHSLGMFYSSFTAFLGFKPNEGEYKVMGLAPYGNSEKYNLKFEDIIYSTKDGGYKLNMDYFEYDWSDDHMFNSKLSEHLGISNRLPEEELTQDYKDLAASVQFQYEKYFFKLLNRLYRITETPNLCLSGGCAYNGTANGKIKEKTKFQNIWIPPAPSDAGSSIGVALESFYKGIDIDRHDNTNPYLGPDYSKQDMLKALNDYHLDVYYEWKPSDVLIPYTAELIAENNIIGWFQGRMEFGARALGNRSILASPRVSEMREKLNYVIKKREGFRPFAPSVISSEQSRWFMVKEDIPFMNQVVKIKGFNRKQPPVYLPSATHVDYSARVHSVTADQNPKYFKLLEELGRISGFSVTLNTSFNLKDQTITMTPEQAVKRYINSDIDYLIINNFIILK